MAEVEEVKRVKALGSGAQHVAYILGRIRVR